MPHPERHARDLALLAMLAWATLAAAQPLAAQRPPEAKPVQSGGQVVHRGHRADRDVAIRIFVPAGRVTVTAWARDSVDVRATLAPGVSFFGGGSATHGKLGVEPTAAGASSLASADFTVSVPRYARVWVKMTEGTIDVDGVLGETELYAVGGRIGVRRGAGSVSVESIEAPVVMERFTGAARVRAGKGSVLLSDVAGTVTVTTVSGAVTVRGARAADARIETIGGAIDMGVRRFGGAVLDLQTHSGDIEIATERAHLPLLELVSRGGSVPKPIPAGNAKEGRVVARTFKGAIRVRDVGGVKGSK